jgi:hypothetical protein
MSYLNQLKKPAFIPMAILGTGIFWGSSPIAFPDATQDSAPITRLFTIHRSTNANVVCYDAHLTTKNEFVSSDPIDVYWLMFADKGQREDLTWFERDHAYGFIVQGTISTTTLTIILQAYEQRPIRVSISDGIPTAEIEIHGKAAVLRDVFVKASGGLFPGVESIELYGVDHETGGNLSETIRP